MSVYGQLRPFEVAMEISSERPFTPARRSSDGDGCAAAVPAWRAVRVRRGQRPRCTPMREMMRASTHTTHPQALLVQALTRVLCIGAWSSRRRCGGTACLARVERDQPEVLLRGAHRAASLAKSGGSGADPGRSGKSGTSRMTEPRAQRRLVNGWIEDDLQDTSRKILGPSNLEPRDHAISDFSHHPNVQSDDLHRRRN